jgi:hypothetical protein
MAATNHSAYWPWNPDDAARHLLVVNPQGEPRYPLIRSDATGKLHIELLKFHSSKVPFTYEQHIGRIVADIENHGGSALFFIHGGMNSVPGAVERGARIYKEYCEGGDNGPYHDLTKQGYPIFICWDSPFVGYAEQLAYVRAGKTEQYGRNIGHKLFAFATLPFHLLADLGRGVVRFPEDWSQFAHNDLYIIAPNLFAEYNKMHDEVACLRGEGAKDCLNLSACDQIDVSRVEPINRSTRYLSDTQTVLLFPVRNLALPVIDWIGVGAWDNMLRHTETMFDRTDTEKSGKRARRAPRRTPVEQALASSGEPSTKLRDARVLEQAVSEGDTGAIAKFFAQLKNSDIVRTGGITLVGHSMGAIICNRIINSYPDLKYSNIVYMGAACSVRDFESSVLPYLYSHRSETEPPNFYNLSLHPRCEAGEVAFMPTKSQSFSVDIAPRGSLPVWIDNIFAHPPSEGQRRYGIYQTAILASHNIPRKIRCQVHLKCFTYGDAKKIAPELLTNPQHHSDFAKAPFWRSEFWQTGHKVSPCPHVASN